jgi:hypothetical protein
MNAAWRDSSIAANWLHPHQATDEMGRLLGEVESSTPCNKRILFSSDKARSFSHSWTSPTKSALIEVKLWKNKF